MDQNQVRQAAVACVAILGSVISTIPRDWRWKSRVGVVLRLRGPATIVDPASTIVSLEGLNSVAEQVHSSALLLTGTEENGYLSLVGKYII